MYARVYCIDARMGEVKYVKCVMKGWRKQYITSYCTVGDMKERQDMLDVVISERNG